MGCLRENKTASVTLGNYFFLFLRGNMVIKFLNICATAPEDSEVTVE
jgi:hypothetical protein